MGILGVGARKPVLLPLLLISVFAAWFPPGDRTTLLNNTEVQADFKSHQWFGATVRTHGDTILVRRFSPRWVDLLF